MACHKMALKIWNWAIDRDIWLTAVHKPGIENVEADHESREFRESLEWMLDPKFFTQICETFGTPAIDLFASRLIIHSTWIVELWIVFLSLLIVKSVHFLLR